MRPAADVVATLMPKKTTGKISFRGGACGREASRGSVYAARKKGVGVQGGKLKETVGKLPRLYVPSDGGGRHGKHGDKVGGKL